GQRLASLGEVHPQEKPRLPSRRPGLSSCSAGGASAAIPARLQDLGRDDGASRPRYVLFRLAARFLDAPGALGDLLLELLEPVPQLPGGGIVVPVGGAAERVLGRVPLARDRKSVV